MKSYDEYLAMAAEQIMDDPDAPESIRIAARIEIEKKESGLAEYEQSEA